LFQDEARQCEIIRTVHEGEQTLDMVSEPPLPKRKKTFSKTSRSVHGEEQNRQNLIKQAMPVLSLPDDEYDGPGKTYAAKLRRRMPAAQRDIADKLINDVLFIGVQSHLTHTTFISDYG
jgi:predicted Zn-dependent peptidase